MSKSIQIPKRMQLIGPALVLALVLVAGLSQAAVAIGTWSTPALVYDPTSVQTTAFSYNPEMIPGSTDRAWTCHSRSSGTIRDDIFMSKFSGGSLVSSTSVLSGSGSGWDNYHNCDPSIVRVDVTYGGTAYSYAMFYTGNDMDCSCHNQVGVAFATGLDGPWTKYPNPVVAFDSSKSTSLWGEGQPSATTVNAGTGTVVLAWSSGYGSNPADTKAYFAQVTFGSGGTPSLSYKHQIQTTGLTNLNGNADFINNFDIVYSTTRDEFFMIREAHPYPTSSPNYISSAVQLASISGSAMWSGSGSWTNVSTLDSSLTGFARTHNPGFSRTIYGTLPNENDIEALVSVAHLDPNALWSYKIYSTSASL